MKILIFINSLGAGGAERSMVEFAKHLQSSAGHSVKFVCLERRKIGLENEVKLAGIDTFYFNGGNLKNKIKFFIEIIKKEQPDILHSVLAESNLVLRLSRIFIKNGWMVQSLVNTPYSLERKKDTNLAWHKFLIAKQIDKWTARMPINIYFHAITYEVLNHYKPLFRIKENYKVIYRGRYENKYLNEGRKNSKELKLINVGRQEFAKGQIDILKALLLLREEYKITDISLEILGRPGQSSPALKKFIEANGLGNQVKINGFVSDVDKRLIDSDVFVFPSYYEGLGGALIEAFAAKLPCICSDIPVLKEVVGKEDGGLFSSPGDHITLAENIRKLYQNPVLRETLGNYSYQRFREAFQMEKINTEMVAMYEEVMNRVNK